MPFSRHFLLLNAIFLLALVPPIHPAPSSYGGGQQQNQVGQIFIKLLQIFMKENFMELTYQIIINFSIHFSQGSSYSNYGQYLGGGANGGGGYRSNSAGGVPISQVEYRVESDASRRRVNQNRIFVKK
jgi:hypothetical protein